jgi:hypothetical protein
VYLIPFETPRRRERERERERERFSSSKIGRDGEDDQLSEGTENITGSSFQVSVLDWGGLLFPLYNVCMCFVFCFFRYS